MDLWMFFVAGLIAGIWIGKILTDYRWASNADKPMRIYYNGRLYKVKYDDNELRKDRD